MEAGGNNPTDNIGAGSSKKKWLLLLTLLGGVIAAVVFYLPHSTGKEAPVEEKKEPLLHRDEPTKDQIYQEDYKDKIHEMLDSGKSVGAVSRETGIRKDVVRKIKKGKE